MLVSTRGRYALRVVIDLAENAIGGFIPMKDVATRQRISLKYITKIMPLLTKGGLVEGVHGKGGGYRLTKNPEQYTVGEILRLTEGSLAPVACLDGDCKGCSRSDECPTLDVWKNLDKLINDYLDGVTLDQLVAPNEGYDYVI